MLCECCMAGPENLRRYEIAEVRRKGLQTGRSLPRGYLQADLDLVHPPGLTPSDKLLAEAELIKVCMVLKFIRFTDAFISSDAQSCLYLFVCATAHAFIDPSVILCIGKGVLAYTMTPGRE